jgi:hypothetical protein
LLLVALLRIVDIQPRVLLVRAITDAQVDYALPDPLAYSHGLVVVSLKDGDRIRSLWLDPTERYNSFGLMYPYLRGQPALNITSASGSDPFLRTPENPSPPPVKEIALELSLEPDGDLLGSGIERISTSQAASYRKLLGAMSSAQREQILQAGLGNYFSGAVLEDHEIGALQDPQQPLALSYRIRVPAFARRETTGGADRLVIPGGFYPYQLVSSLISKPDRRLPLLLGDETRTSSRVVLTLPPGATVPAPKALSLRAPLSEFHYNASLEDGKLVIEKSLVVKAGRISPKDYPAFMEFCRQVDQKDTEQIVVQLGTSS